MLCTKRLMTLTENYKKINDFELLIQNTNGATLSSSSYSKIDYMNDIENCSEKYLCINVVDLCLRICSATQKYYMENKNKFDFMKDKIVTTTRDVRKMILFSDNLEYSEVYKLDQGKIKTKWDLLYEK